MTCSKLQSYKATKLQNYKVTGLVAELQSYTLHAERLAAAPKLQVKHGQACNLEVAREAEPQRLALGRVRVGGDDAHEAKEAQPEAEILVSPPILPDSHALGDQPTAERKAVQPEAGTTMSPPAPPRWREAQPGASDSFL